MTQRFGCVLLTTGRKPDDLRLALDSLLRQRGVETDIVVVGNGWDPVGLPEGVRGVHVAVDEGIPAGRNAGVPHVSGDLLFFLDDDATLRDDDALARVAELFRSDPAIGLIQLEVAPRNAAPPWGLRPLDGPEGRLPRDWVPRLRVGDRRRPSDVTVVWEGAVAMPRAVFEQVGGWPEEFRFVHEGVDLAWRVMDAGHRVRYAAERHGYSVRYAARNRVFVARRNLPWPLGVLYVATFALRTLRGLKTPELRAAAREGYRAGRTEDCGRRRRLRARTIWRMTKLGRPPVI